MDYRNKAIVEIKLVEGLSPAEMIEVAAIIGYQNNCVAQFTVSGTTIRAYYDSETQDYAAKILKDGTWQPVPREDKRWGEFVEVRF